MRSLVCSLVLAAASAAQSATVTTTADSGAGSLRAAIAAATASGAAAFTIEVAPAATAAPIALASLLPPLQRSNLTIRALAGAGRLTVDANGPTGAGGNGLEIRGNDVQVLIPCRVLVRRGNGVVVQGARARFTDLQAIGNRGSIGLAALAGANDLVLGRFYADTFQQGLLLDGCQRARIADDGVSIADVRNGSSTGIAIQGGRDHVVGSFASIANEVGVYASGCSGLRIGRDGNPRSAVLGNRQQGILLAQCTGASLANADGLFNGTGLHVLGGSGFSARHLELWANTNFGVVLEGSATNLRLGPGVNTRGETGLQDIGLLVRAVGAVTVVDCSFGPDHRIGVQLGQEGSVAANQVTLCRCTVRGNREKGMGVSSSRNALICSSSIDANLGDGLNALAVAMAAGAIDLVIANSSVSRNIGDGLVSRNVDGLQIGPGNRIEDNYYGGLLIGACDDVVIADNLGIDRNRNGGLWLMDCSGTVIARTPLRGNFGAGIQAARCTGVVMGPAVNVHDTIGTGIEWLGSEGCSLFSSQITGNNAFGLHAGGAFGTNPTAPNRVQSCLIADNPGLAVQHSTMPPLTLELCTIAGNLRGISSSNHQPTTVDSCIVHSNYVEDVQQSATVSVSNTIQGIPTALAGTSNTSLYPEFLAPALRDWRLQPFSPAVGRANQSIPLAPGALDAFGGARRQGALDAGAYEVGPHPAPPTDVLRLSSPTMAHGGSGLAFQAEFAPQAAGLVSVLLLQFGAPAGPSPAFGATLPIAVTPELTLAARDSFSAGTVGLIPPGGVTSGALLWAGHLPGNIANLQVSLCAVAFDFTGTVRHVTNAATFTIQ